MRRCLWVLTAVIACAAGMMGVAQARPLSSSARTRPAPVTHLHTYLVRNGATVHWQNPTVATFGRAVVRYLSGPNAPATPAQGRPVRLVRGLPNAARITGLAPDTRYSVSVWALDKVGRRSARRTASLVSSGPRPTPGTYSGRVVDDAGHPLLNAEVDAFDYDFYAEAHEVHATSAVDGTFTLMLPPGQWYVGVGGQHVSGGDSDPTGYVATADLITARAGRTTRGDDIVLEPGAAITGRVTDAAGDPLTAARVFVAPVQSYVLPDPIDALFGSYADDSGAVSTGPDGAYTLKGAPTDGAVRVCAETGPTSITGGDSDAIGYTDRCLPGSTLASPASADPVADLRLDGALGGSLAGRVTRPDSTGAAASYVEIDEIGGDGFGNYASTEPDGSYSSSGLEPGRYRVCAAAGVQPDSSRTGYSSTCVRGDVAVFAAHRSTANVRLGVGAAVTGRLTVAGGAPVSGADVQVRGKGVSALATSDATGHYRVKGLPSGVYLACLVDTSGATAPGVPSGVTRACFAGRTHVSARAGAVRSGVDLRLAPGGAVSGTATGSSGEPASYAQVELDPVGFVGSSGGFVVADRSGRYEIHGVPPGVYRACFTSSSSDLGTEIVRCHPGHLIVVPGRLLSGVDVVLPSAASISVAVTDAGGHPVAGADAAALSPCDGICNSPRLFGGHVDTEVDGTAVSDSRGVATLTGVRPGRYAVCVFTIYATTAAGGAADGYADQCSGTTFDVSVRSGAVTSLAMTLADGGAVTGRIVDTSGTPIRGVLVHVSGSAADDYGDEYTAGNNDFSDEFFGDFGDPTDDSRSRADGTFTVRGVAPGSQRVCASTTQALGADPAGYVDRCLVTPSGGSRVTVTGDLATSIGDLALSPGAGISGKVVAVPGRAPVRDAAVYLVTRQLNLVQEVSTGADGTYEFTRVPPRRYLVCAAAYRRAGQCWRGVAWDYETGDPPMRSTLVTATAGAVTTGIGFRLAALRSR